MILPDPGVAFPPWGVAGRARALVPGAVPGSGADPRGASLRTLAATAPEGCGGEGAPRRLGTGRGALTMASRTITKRIDEPNKNHPERERGSRYLAGLTQGSARPSGGVIRAIVAVRPPTVIRKLAPPWAVTVSAIRRSGYRPRLFGSSTWTTLLSWPTTSMSGPRSRPGMSMLSAPPFHRSAAQSRSGPAWCHCVGVSLLPGSGSTRIRTCGGGVSHQDSLAVIPAFICHGAEI